MQISDFIDASRARLSEDKELVELARALESSAVWKRYCEVLTEMANSLGGELLFPLQSLDATYIQEYTKGTIKGLLFATTMPSVLLEQAAALAAEEEEGE